MLLRKISVFSGRWLISLAMFASTILLPFDVSATSKVLLLDGQTTERVIVENSEKLNPVSAISIEAWVRPAGVSGCETVVGKGYETAYWLGICNGKIRYYINGTFSSADGNALLPAGLWTHIAVTFDGERRRYYVNGELDLDVPWNGTSGINSLDLGIGGEGASDSYPDAIFPFTGRISEVRLWSHARTQAEIRELMYEQLTDRVPGMLAVWPLDGSASDRFGDHYSVLAPGASFSSLKSPPVPHDPLVIRGSSGILINGDCSDAGYASAVREPAWYPASDKLVSERNPDEIYLAATGVYLFVCLPTRATQTNPIYSVEIDANNDAGALLDTDDYRFQYWPAESGLTTTKGKQFNIGNNTFSSWGTAVSNPQGLWAQEDLSTEFVTDFELRIPRNILPSVGGSFRIRVNHSYIAGGGERLVTWPAAGELTVPSTWQEFRFDLTTPPQADSLPPRVYSLRIDERRITEGDLNGIVARAGDDVDIELVEILIDGNVVYSEEFPGLSDTNVTAEYMADFNYAMGRHTYSARAYDQAGLIGQNLYRSFHVEIDGEPPRVALLISPRNPVPGQITTVTAIATDPSGIRNIRISTVFGDYLPNAKNCDFPAGGTLESCSWQINPGSDVTMLRLVATASDAEGFADTTGDHLVLWGNNSGPDSDDDGLSDFVERGLCTNQYLPDSDFDGLSDGWEILGIQFKEGKSLHLPDFGVNPCWKDILLQLDFEVGASPQGVTNLQNQFRDRNTRVFVEQNRRPNPTAYDQSHIGALDAVYLQDDEEYYFSPERQWAFYYGYHRNLPGDSGAGGRFFTIDSSAGRSGYCFAGEKDGESCRGDWECPGGACAAGCAGGSNAGNACSTPTECPIEDGSFARCDAPCVTLPGATGRACGTKGDLPFRLFHELGHSIGLGHGGMAGSLSVSVDRGFVTTENDWNNQNFKPQQVSAMNYMYNQGKLCMQPIPSPLPERYGPELVGELTFMDEPMGDLNENALSESPSSQTANGLRDIDCSHAEPGAIPVIRYTCKFDDVQMQVLTDGTRTVARAPKGGDWSFQVPSHGPGIDWNCNGVIDSETVAQNIDASGKRARGFSWDEALWQLDDDLAGREEFPLAPKPLKCQSLYRASCKDRTKSCYVWPQEYRDGILDLASGLDMVDCRDEFLGRRESHSNEDCRGGLDSEFTTQTCPLFSLESPTANNRPLKLLGESDSIDWTAGPLSDVVNEAEEGASVFEVPGVEQCDGDDNDGDGEVDENCRDTDNDEVPDAIDNCPITANTDQRDRDRDGLGDDCQFPSISNLQASWNGITKVNLNWVPAGAPLKGVAIYRYNQKDRQPVYRGAQYPSSSGNSFTDSVNSTNTYTYIVRPINVDGREGEPVFIDVNVSVANGVYEDSFEN